MIINAVDRRTECLKRVRGNRLAAPTDVDGAELHVDF